MRMREGRESGARNGKEQLMYTPSLEKNYGCFLI
jgi:hypothetical protein